MLAKDYVNYAQDRGLLGDLIMATNNNYYGYSHRILKGRPMRRGDHYVFQMSVGSKKVYLEAASPAQYSCLEKGAKDPKNFMAQMIQSEEGSQIVCAYDKNGQAGIRMMEMILVDFLDYVGPENKTDIKSLCKEARQIIRRGSNVRPEEE